MRLGWVRVHVEKQTCSFYQPKRQTPWMPFLLHTEILKIQVKTLKWLPSLTAMRIFPDGDNVIAVMFIWLSNGSVSIFALTFTEHTTFTRLSHYFQFNNDTVPLPKIMQFFGLKTVFQYSHTCLHGLQQKNGKTQQISDCCLVIKNPSTNKFTNLEVFINKIILIHILSHACQLTMSFH